MKPSGGRHFLIRRRKNNTTTTTSTVPLPASTNATGPSGIALAVSSSSRTSLSSSGGGSIPMKVCVPASQSHRLAPRSRALSRIRKRKRSNGESQAPAKETRSQLNTKTCPAPMQMQMCTETSIQETSKTKSVEQDTPSATPALQTDTAKRLPPIEATVYSLEQPFDRGDSSRSAEKENAVPQHENTVSSALSHIQHETRPVEAGVQMKAEKPLPKERAEQTKSTVLQKKVDVHHWAINGISQPLEPKPKPPTQREHTQTVQKVQNENPRTEQVANSVPKRQTLSFWGIPDDILQNYRNAGVSCLFDWQLECLDASLVDASQGPMTRNRNLVYSAPTGMGKTLVAEILLIRRVLESRSQRLAIFVLPYLSVVVEKTNYFKKIFRGSSIMVQGLHGRLAGSQILSSSCGVCICTIERASGVINRLIEKNELHRVCCVVCDEVHMLADKRGHKLESLLTKIVYHNHQICAKVDKAVTSDQSQILHTSQANDEIQVVALSATLPNIDDLGRWLNASVYSCVKRSNTTLSEYAVVDRVVMNGAAESCRELSSSSLHSRIAELCSEVVSSNRLVLVFCSSKAKCSSIALSLAKELPALIPAPTSDIVQKRNKLLSLLKRLPSGLDEGLRKSVPIGAAQHHAGMLMEERELIEEAFREGVLSILTATSTLSAGVNLPAARVIIESSRVGRSRLGMAQYRQMVGRAGRVGRGCDGNGDSYLMLLGRERSMASEYLSCKLPSLRSSLGRSSHGGIASILLEAVACGLAQTNAELERLVKSTFLWTCPAISEPDLTDGHEQCQRDEARVVWQASNAALDGLCKSEFIQWRSNDHRWVGSKLGLAAFASGLSPDDALVVYRSLSKALDRLRLDNDLHMVYLVTPVYHSLQPDWSRFLNWYNLASGPLRDIADTIGIEERVLQLQASPAPGLVDQKSLLIHRRFWAAVILQQLLGERRISSIASQYGCGRGDLQSLLSLASTFSGMVVAFCKRLQWHELVILCGGISARLVQTAPPPLSMLLRLPGMDVATARKLFRSGIRSIKEVAESDSLEIARVMRDAAPFEAESSSQDRRHHLGHFKLGAEHMIRAAKSFKKTEASEMKKAMKNNVRNASMMRPSNASSTPSLPMQSSGTHETVICTLASSSSEVFTSFVANWTEQKRFAIHLMLKNFETDGECSDEAGVYEEASQFERTTRNSCMFIAIYWADSPVYILRFEGDEIGAAVIWRTLQVQLQRIETVKVMFSAKRVLQYLMQMGISYKGRVEDPVVAMSLLNLEQKKLFRNIDEIASSLLPRAQNTLFRVCADDSVGGFDRDVGSSAAILAAKRCWNSFHTMQKLRSMLTSQGLWDLFTNVEMPVCLALAQVEYVGFGLHRAILYSYDWHLGSQLAALQQRADNISGRSVRIRSPQDLEKLLFDELASPHQSTGRNTQAITLQKLVQNGGPGGALASIVLQFRALDTIHSRWVKTLPRRARFCATSCMMRVHSTFKQTHASTGRVVVSFPNLQAVPKSTTFHPVHRRSVDEEMLDEGSQGLVQALCSQPQDDSRRVIVTNMDSSGLPLPGILQDVIDNRSITCSFSSQKSATLAEYWRMAGFSYSSSNERTVAQVQVLVYVDKHTQKTLAYPADKVWRIHAFGDDDGAFPENKSYPWPLQYSVNPRLCMVAANGCVLVSADYRQIEARIMAHLSEDLALCEAISGGGDVIRTIASQWLGVPESEISDDQRAQAKSVLYGLLYGIGPKALAQQMSVAPAKASNFMEQFLDLYEGIRKFISKQIDTCRRQGFVCSILGRRRYLPDIRSEHADRRSKAERQAVNTVCQGSAADIVKLAMISVHSCLHILSERHQHGPQHSIPREEGDPTDFGQCCARMVLQIHDELVVEVRKECLDEVVELLRECMIQSGRKLSLRVPLEVEVKTGDRFGDMRPYS